MMEDDTALWVAHFNSDVFRCDLATGRWKAFSVRPGPGEGMIFSNRVTVMKRDREGRVWLGTEFSGLGLYDQDTDSFRQFFDPDAGLETIFSVMPADGGRIWVGTGTALVLFSPDEGVVTSFGEADGLPTDYLTQLHADDHGHLWVSTGRGLARIDPGTREIVLFDKDDGLPANEIHLASFRRPDGTLYYGGKSGMVSFQPDSVRVNPFVPPVVLTGLWIADKPVTVEDGTILTRTLARTDAIDLDYRQNDLALEFSALHFGRPERNLYRYRLEPYDDDWREAGTRRRAAYTNLDPGEYVFEVMGSNADGVWNPEPRILAITIHPPWWQTARARALYVILVLLAVAWVIAAVVRRERLHATLRMQRAKAEHLQELDQVKSQFFANVSHEFRTPLSLLDAGLQRLSEDPEPEQKGLLAAMNRNARRLGQLIDQLMDLSRIEAKRMPVLWQRGDWLAYLRAVTSAFETPAEAAGVALRTDWPEAAGNAWFDADLFEKIVANLLNNALKFTPAGGAITVTGRLDDDRIPRPVPGTPPGADARLVPAAVLTLAVHNTGSYIPPGDLEHVFERFYQVAGDETRGTGIGLSLVKELVGWHGGRVAVVSSEDEGTTFTVVLPLFLGRPFAAGAAAEATGAARDDDDFDDDEDDWEDGAETVAASAGEDTATVLVVEDNPDLRALLVRELGERYQVLEAADGRAGLDLARDEIPDLVLTDLMMPGIDGLELCRRLKTDERTSHVPVVVLTALTDTQSRITGFEIGADDYLPKPFDLREIKTRIANLIVQRRNLAARLADASLVTVPPGEPVESSDDLFLARAREVVAGNLEDPDFKVSQFCVAIGMSRTQLHRKMKAVTGQTTGDFLRNQRLRRAAELLEARAGNVTEVAYRVGFRNLSHFAKAFRDAFGTPPSEYGR